MSEREACVCAPQWIASGVGCMCWPLTTPTADDRTTTDARGATDE